jgi:hypothetical protein
MPFFLRFSNFSKITSYPMAWIGACVPLLLLMMVAPAASFHAPSVLTLSRSMAPVRAQLRGGAAPSLSLFRFLLTCSSCGSGGFVAGHVNTA